jgi:N-methylhydantoinase A
MKMRFAADTGGTFTDLVIEDDEGKLSMYKASTVPNNPVQGVLDAFQVAADAMGVGRQMLLANGQTFIHGTTHAINAIITKRTARTALLVTKGHPDILVLREGGRLEPFNHSVRYPDPYVPRALTFEIPERILADGTVRTALDEAAVVAIAKQLKAQNVEACAICLLWSIINPAHERRVAEILREHNPDMAITLSCELNPSLREYRRAISSGIDASLKPLMSRYLKGLSAAMNDAGFDGRILILSSQGGMVDIQDVQQSPILAINSGPSMAPVAAAQLAEAEDLPNDVVVFDTGGTTFDVSLVRGGRIPFTQETWLGRPFQSDLTGFPSVDVRSIGAGGGSIAWVEGGRILRVGPQSAGAVPGPVCYLAGGVNATVTDAALVLGYIDPDYFLGGRMKLDRPAAYEAVKRDVADPLGLTVEDAAASILEVWTEMMVQAIADITVNQGIDPALASVIGGGGAAGLNAVAIAARLGCPNLVVPEVSAALSAVGAISSGLTREFRSLLVMRSDQLDAAKLRAVKQKLAKEADEFIARSGVPANTATVTFTVEARYLHQVWEIDVAVDPAEVAGPDGAALLEKAFHEAHERIFAFADIGSPVETVAWRCQASCPLTTETKMRLEADATASATPASRKVYYAGHGWLDSPVIRFDDALAAKGAKGPAIVETPFTSVVVNPGVSYRISDKGNMIVDATTAG